MKSGLFRCGAADSGAMGRCLLLWLGVYLGLHIWMRLAFSSTLQVDDAEQVLHAGHLLLGYEFPQPPLYTWLTWGAFQVFGPSLAVVTVIKYLQIAALFHVTWRLSWHLFVEPLWRAAAVMSYLLLPVFAWQMHVGFTHTVMMALAMAMTLHALLSLGASRDGKRYAYLALAIALGMYAKFGFFLYLLLLAFAALATPRYRAVLGDRRMAAVLVVCLVLAAPYYGWLIEHWAWFNASLAGKMEGEHRLHLGVLAHARLLLAGVEYALPLLLVLLWVFPRLYLPPRLFPRNTAEPGDPERLLGRFHLVLLAIMLILMVVKPVDYVKSRWMVTVLFPLPFWLLLRARRAYPEWVRGMRRLLLVGIALSVLIVGVRLVDFAFGARWHADGRVHLPVMRTLASLPLDPRGAAFLVDNPYEAAHVAIAYPGIPLYCLSSRPPDRPVPPPDRLILLWLGGTTAVPPIFPDYLATKMGVIPATYQAASQGTLHLPDDWLGYVVHYAEWVRSTGDTR